MKRDDAWVPGAYLKPAPRTWPEFVFADMQRGIRLVKKIHPDPIDPQIRIGTPEGDYWLALMLGDAPQQYEYRMALIKDFLAFKQAVSFIWVSELKEPDAVVSIGVTRETTIGMMSVISRTPLDFSKPVLLQAEQIDDAMAAMLPRGAMSLSKSRIQLLETWFGPNGRYPAVLMSDDGVQGGHG